MEKKEQFKLSSSRLVGALINDELIDKQNLEIPISELVERRGFDWVCQHRKLSEEFLEEWFEEFSVKNLLEHQELSREFINSFRLVLQFKCVKERVSFISADTSGEEVRDMVSSILKTSFSYSLPVKVMFTGEAGEYFLENYVKPFNLKVNSRNSIDRIKFDLVKNLEIKKNAIIFFRGTENSAIIMYII